MLLVFKGTGKGKTTAAFGTVFRALGRGWPVLVAQFLKSGDSGEVKFLRSLLDKLPRLACRVKVVVMGTKEFVTPGDVASDAALINTAYAYGFLKFLWPQLRESFKPKLTLLDELGIAVHMGLVDEWSVLECLEPYRGNVEEHVIVTGRRVPRTIIDAADLVSDVREVKHYFRKGFTSLEGLDL